MTHQDILDEFLSLPAEAQSQVVSLIALLKQKYLCSEPESPSPNSDLTNDPFVGMWKDRQDLGSRAWMRTLRETDSTEFDSEDVPMETEEELSFPESAR